MKRLLMVLLVSIGYNTSACSCVGKAEIKNELKSSDVVFTGTVSSKKIINVSDTVNFIKGQKDTIYDIINTALVEYEFEVQEVYKGKVRNRKLKIITGQGRGDCGYPFLIGARYVVYAKKKKFKSIKGQSYYTDICMRTVVYDPNEVRQIKSKKR